MLWFQRFGPLSVGDDRQETGKIRYGELLFRGITGGRRRTLFGPFHREEQVLDSHRSRSQPQTDQAQLFILNLDDQIGLNELQNRFPNGSISRYNSAVVGRDFLIYLVPPGIEEDS